MDYRVIKEGNKLCTYVNIGGRMIKIRGEEKKKKDINQQACTQKQFCFCSKVLQDNPNQPLG